MDKNPYFKPEWLTNPTAPEIDDFYFKNRKSVSENSSFIIHHSSLISASALNKMNISYLKEKLHEAVISQKINLESTIVTNARHFEALQKAYESLDDVLKGMDSGITSDFIAMDIRRSLQFLGEITGEISTDDLLGNIFSNFCIGK